MGWLCTQMYLRPHTKCKRLLMAERDVYVYVQRYGREEVMGMIKINARVIKQRKWNWFQKSPKQGQALLKNGMGPTKKPNQFLRIKSQTGVPNKLKFSGTLIFWFTNMKTVFKNGVPNKPTKSKIFLPNNMFF